MGPGSRNAMAIFEGVVAFRNPVLKRDRLWRLGRQGQVSGISDELPV
jgi:hypothetical protein